MKTRLRLLLITLFIAALTCGLSISASAVQNIGADGLQLPDEGTGTFADTDNSNSITVSVSGDTYTVTLSNATIENVDQAIYFYGYDDDADGYVKNLEIVLEGTNIITTTSNSSAAIQAACVNFTLSGSGTLSVTTPSGSEGAGIEIDAVGDVNFSNTGKLTVNADSYGVNIINYSDDDLITATLSGPMDITGGSAGLRVNGGNLLITGSDVNISSTDSYDVLLDSYSFSGISITIPEGVCNSALFFYADDFSTVNCSFAGLQVLHYYNAGKNTYNGTLSGAVTIDTNLQTLLSSGNDYGPMSGSGIICNLTIATGATVTIPSGYELKLDDTLADAVFDSVTVNGSIVNNGTLYISQEGSAKVSGTGKTIVSGMIEVNGSYYQEGSDITSVGFDFKNTTLPTLPTCYKAGTGYVLFNPSSDEGYDSDTITFFGASFSDSTGDMEFQLGTITQLVLLGTNTIVADYTSGGASMFSTGNLTISGTGASDSLTISGQGTDGITVYGSLTIQNCTLTLYDACDLSGVYGVVVTGSTVSMTDGDAVTGIYSYSGDISITNSTVNIKSIQQGIYAVNGKVTIGGTGTCNIEVSGSSEYEGISAAGSVSIGGSVDGSISAAGIGIEAGGDITLSTTGTLSITSSGSRGIEAFSGKVTLGDAENETAEGSITICSSSEGIRTDGAITANNLNTLSVTSTAHTGMYSGDTVTFNGITDMIVSANGAYGIYGKTPTLTDIGALSITNTDSAGIYTSIDDITLTNVSGSITATQYAVYAGAAVTINTSGDKTSEITLTVSNVGDYISPIKATDITIGNGAAVTVGTFYFAYLTVEKGGKLTSTGNLVPTGFLKIYETTALGTGTTISVSAADKCLLIATAPTDDMVVVPSGLTYTGSVLTADTSLDISKANATVCDTTFTVTADGWEEDDYAVVITDSDSNTTVKDAGTYTVTYSNGDISASNTFTVAPADIADTTTATTQTVVLLGGAVTLPTAPTGTTVDGSAITVKYSNDSGSTYTDDSVSYSAAGIYAVYYELSATNHESITGTITLTVEDIVFSEAIDDTISSVYGKTWNDILGFTQSTYAATLGSDDVSGTYTLTIGETTYDSTAIPTVGSYNWAVTFTSTPVNDVSIYENIAVDNGTVVVGNASITNTTTSTETVTYTGDAIDITAPSGTTVNEQTLSVTYSTSENGDYTATLPSYTNADNYTVWYTLSAPNHDDLKASLIFTINQVASEGNVTENTDDDTKTYLTGGESIIYGESYYIEYTPTIAPVSNGIAVMSMDMDELTFADETVVLYYGSTAVATATGITLGDTATLSFTVTKALFTDATAFDGTADAFTIGWGGDNNATGTSDTIYFNLTKAIIDDVSVDGTYTSAYTSFAQTFSDIALTSNDVTTGNTVTLTTSYTTTAASVGDYTVTGTVTLGGADAGYYALANDITFSGKVSIIKATYGDQTTTGSAMYGNSGSVSLSAWTGLDGYSFTIGDVTDSMDVLVADSYKIENDTLVFTIVSVAANVGEEATIEITVSSISYENFTVSVVVEVLDLFAQDTLSFTNNTYVPVSGELTLAVDGGSTNGAITYTVENGTGAATISGTTLTPVTAGTVTVTATMAGNGTYADVSASMDVVILAITTDSVDVATVEGDATLTNDGMNDSSFDVVVATTVADEDKAKFTVPSGYTEGETFYLYAVMNGAVVDDAKFSGNITVTIDYAVLSNRTYQVLHYMQNGTVETISATANVSEQKLSFVVSELSPFMVVSKAISSSSSSSSSDSATSTVTMWYVVTLSTSGGGTLAPELSDFSTVTMKEGTSYTFNITPDSGYAISAVYVDGTNIGAVSSYTIDSIVSDRSIHVDFVSTSASTEEDAIDEAVEEDATTTEADDTADSATVEDADVASDDTDEAETTESTVSESDSDGNSDGNSDSNSGSALPIVGGVVAGIAALGGIGYFIFKRKFAVVDED